MFWEHSGDDMDPHLLNPEGAADDDGDGLADGLKSTDDCYYGKHGFLVERGSRLGCGGGLSTIRSDPDDISAPDQNINIESPADGV